MTFSKQPRPSAKAKPQRVVEPRQISGSDKSLDLFKKTYVMERRTLDSIRLGSGATVYYPAKSLEGGKRYNTPEEKEKPNQWVEAYKKLLQLAKPQSPIQHLRILFFLLRRSALDTPTVLQLASERYLDLVNEFMKFKVNKLQAAFISESNRAKSAIVFNSVNKGTTVQDLLTIVYSTVLDARLELSPLFRYCLVSDALSQAESKAIVNQSSIYSKLKEYVEQIEFLAALDYTVFPEAYDYLYGKTMPSRLKELASSIVQKAMDT